MVIAKELNVHIINMIHKAKEVNDQQVINKIQVTEETQTHTKRRIIKWAPKIDLLVIGKTARERTK